MSTKRSPITPTVLTWGIAEDGRTVEEIAVAVKVEPADLNAWMRGEALPRVGQLTDLAKVLKRPRAFFFLPSPPSSSAMPHGFRHPPGASGATVPANVLIEARRAQRLQRAIASIVAEDERPQIPRATVTDSANDAAEAARAWLGVSGAARWADDRAALRGWRGALDEAGVLVFELQLGMDQVRGFASWDERAPLIVVNQSGVNPSARLYTLGRELAHLVLREATACIEPRGAALTIDNRTERWCEQFAAALLMPAVAVRELMRQRGIGLGHAELDEVKALMNTFRVSGRAAALRLSDLGFAQSGLYSRVLTVFVAKKRPGTGTPRNPPRYKARLRQYGLRTVGTLLHSFPEDDALSILRMNVDDMRRLADEVPGVLAL